MYFTLFLLIVLCSVNVRELASNAKCYQCLIFKEVRIKFID